MEDRAGQRVRLVDVAAVPPLEQQVGADQVGRLKTDQAGDEVSAGGESKHDRSPPSGEKEQEQLRPGDHPRAVGPWLLWRTPALPRARPPYVPRRQPPRRIALCLSR